jgi:hypothetical protein
MANERTLWLVWREGDAELCFKSELSALNAWARLYSMLELPMNIARAAGWRCDQITVEDKGP